VLSIGVHTGSGPREEISRQLSSVGAIAWFTDAAQLVERAAEGALDAAVVGLTDEAGRSIAPTLVELAAHRPGLPVVVHAAVSSSTLDALCAAFALGLRLECAARPFALLHAVLQYVLAPSYRPGVAPLLLHRLMPLVPPRLGVFVALAILEAPARRRAAELATWTRQSARTIERRLAAAEWPTMRVVLQSFAALDAAWLMTQYGWSARRVQQVRGFVHPSGVTRLLAAYAGTKPSTLMDDGGFPAALDHVMRVLLPERRE
jgi:hypothetical protein